jgi:hypothetical protein
MAHTHCTYTYTQVSWEEKARQSEAAEKERVQLQVCLLRTKFTLYIDKCAVQHTISSIIIAASAAVKLVQQQ